MDKDELSALGMSLFAGLSTGIGGCAVFFVSTVSSRVLAFALSLAAGVMIAVSVLELFRPILSGSVKSIIWALVGSLFYSVLRNCLPENTNNVAAATGHKREMDDPSSGSDLAYRAHQWRLGLLMMMTLTAHNLPEGVAVAVGALKSTHTGLIVMSAIAMHNIPEGLAIAIPIYAASGSRWKALSMTLASGLSEPIGAALGILFLRPFLTVDIVDHATCAVGGIMFAVSVFELVPEALKYREPLTSCLGFILGWAIILLTITYA